jgi:hypothetical protein
MKVIISLLFLFTALFSFAQEDPWEYVEELTNELEASNELIIELRDEILDLEAENEELQERPTTEEFEELGNLEAENEELQERPTTKEYNRVVNQLEETTEELIISNELIRELRQELTECQSEVTFFRNEYEECILKETMETNFGFGAGVTYPNGGEIFLSIDVPFINTLSVYARGGLQVNNIFHGGTGIIYRF